MKKLRLTICSLRLAINTAVFCCTVYSLSAAPLFFDLGTEKSAVYPGFEQVTEKSIFGDKKDFGWESTDGLKSTSRVFQNPEEKGEPRPPMITNPITEDVISGEKDHTFRIAAPAGEYHVYLICGSASAQVYEYHDFTVAVGKTKRRVQIEGPHHFKPIQFTTRISADQAIDIRLSPTNRFLVNAILVWPVSEDEQVRKEVLDPLIQKIWLLPPEEWEKWKEVPRPAEEPPEFSEAIQKQGYALYSRPYVEPIFPQSAPKEEELSPELRAFATPGEYEPLTFAVYPLKDWKSAKVKAADFGPIPTKNIDVRHVRYMRARPNYTVPDRWRWVPDVLERFDSVPLKKGQSERFWLTVQVPEDTPEGNYTGSVTLTLDDRIDVDIPVKFRVLPFRLQEDPDKIYGIYYRHPIDRAYQAKDEHSAAYLRRKAELEHQDMVAHGTRNVILGFYVSAKKKEGKFDINWEPMEEKIALARKYNFSPPFVVSINAGGIYHKYMKSYPGSHLAEAEDPPAEFEKDITEMVKEIEKGRKERGFPEFLYYPFDEPGRDAAAVNLAMKALRACKEAGVRTYVTAAPVAEAFEPLRPYVDVWCTQPFDPERKEVLANSKAQGIEYWCYPNHVNGENDHTPTAGARMTYGFGFWRSGFRTLIPWIYSFSVGDPFNYLDGRVMDFFNRHEPDGTPIPVALWEAYREGYDDYRYIYTLSQRIEQAKDSKDKQVQTQLEEAREVLKSIWESIAVQEKYKEEGLWKNGIYDVYRWMIADQIIKIDRLLE